MSLRHGDSWKIDKWRVKRILFKRFKLYVSSFKFLVSSCSCQIAEVPRLNLKPQTRNQQLLSQVNDSPFRVWP